MSRVGILSIQRWPRLCTPGPCRFLAEWRPASSPPAEAAGYEVVLGTVPITSNEVAVSEARRLAAQRPDLTVFNYPVWAFPHFSVHAAHATTRALTAFLQHRPRLPGHGLDAGRRREPGPARAAPRAALGRHQLNRRCGPALATSSRRHAVRSLEGSTFGSDRWTLDGHVHGRRAHRRVDAPLWHRRRRDRPMGDRPPLRPGPAVSGDRWQGMAGKARRLASTTTANA